MRLGRGLNAPGSGSEANILPTGLKAGNPKCCHHKITAYPHINSESKTIELLSHPARYVDFTLLRSILQEWLTFHPVSDYVPQISRGWGWFS